MPWVAFVLTEPVVRRGVVFDLVVADAVGADDACGTTSATDTVGADDVADTVAGACADDNASAACVGVRGSDRKNKMIAAAKAAIPIAPMMYPAGLRLGTA